MLHILQHALLITRQQGAAVMRTALALAAFSLLAGCAATPAPSAPPAPASWRQSYASTPHEEARPGPDDALIWREEVFDVPRPASDYYPDFLVGGAHLENFLHGTAAIPGVDHNEDLTPLTFPAVGSRRLVCLKNGGWAVEEVLARDDHGFRYLVSNYSLPEARPIAYAIGEFRFDPLTPSSTRVTWRYSFKLRSDRFPGWLGAPGRWLFRQRFLDGDYADFMRAAVVTMTAWAMRSEAPPAP
jgi:hypothetical protein